MTVSSVRRESMAPVGFDGLFTMIAFVRGLIAFLICSGAGSKPVSIVVSTSTGTPPATRTMSAYETQNGVKMTTSSPSFRSAWNRL